MKVHVTGGDAMVARIRRIAEKFPDLVAAAMYQEALIEMTEAKRRTPVGETGNLKASGRVAEPVRNGRQLTVALSFGTPYAIYVHENLEALHRVGQAKFLESTLRESQPYMAERIARRVAFNKAREEE